MAGLFFRDDNESGGSCVSGTSAMIVTASIRTKQLPEDFEKIFRDHSDFIFRTACRVTGSEEDAEDVLQTLFLRLLQEALTPEIQANPRAYLYRAAVNTSLNVIRSRKRQVLTDDFDAFERRSGVADSRADSAVSETLRLALAELSPKAAEIFILRHVHGYSDLEIGRLLGTSRGTIAINLFRSRRRLRKAIRKHLGEK